MSTPQEQAQCVLWLAELQSRTAVQRPCRTQYGRQPPTRKSIRFWDNKLRTTGSLLRVWLWPDVHTWTCWSCMRCLQQDRASPHFCHQVRNHLNREMVGKWIGRGEPIAWPPRSPDLTRLDFSCGITWRILSYQVKINDLQHLKDRMRDAVATVTPNMLQATWNEVEYRLDICRATMERTLKFIEKLIYSEKNLWYFLFFMM
jgi:hypothetical protein